MRVVITLCGIATCIVSFLIGLVWALAIFAPVYFFLALIVFFFMRRRRRENALRTALAVEAKRQRIFNEQEYRAWQNMVNEALDQDARRDRTLKRIDSVRK